MELRTASPEEMGLCSTQLIRARDYAEAAGEQLGASGGAVMVLRHGRVVAEWYWGRRSASENARPWDADTIAWVLSMTKGFTATALALLIEDGTLWLDEPAHLHIPELARGDKAKITIRHLATHSSGIPAQNDDWYQSWKDASPGEHVYEAYLRHALLHPLAYEPGTSQTYSDLAVCVLGEIIYRASGLRVPDLLRRRVFDPLGLRRIGWDFDDEIAKDIAWCIEDNWTHQRLNSKAARKDGALWGGMLASARDLASFGLMLLNEGQLSGVRVMAPLTVRMMTSCQMPLPARPHYPHRGLFWWIKAAPDSPELGQIVPFGTYCHGGASHCVLVVMPELDVVAVMLRNRVGTPPGFLYARDYPVFMDLVAAAVPDI
jgi:CubicO group peptidase (beta-lactamase class C family)